MVRLAVFSRLQVMKAKKMYLSPPLFGCFGLVVNNFQAKAKIQTPNNAGDHCKPSFYDFFNENLAALWRIFDRIRNDLTTFGARILRAYEREARVEMFRVNSILNHLKPFRRALHAFARKMRALQS
jgi:hypothetical protein